MLCAELPSDGIPQIERLSEPVACDTVLRTETRLLKPVACVRQRQTADRINGLQARRNTSIS